MREHTTLARSSPTTNRGALRAPPAVPLPAARLPLRADALRAGGQGTAGKRGADTASRTQRSRDARTRRLDATSERPHRAATVIRTVPARRCDQTGT
jgi:hypothetical protein